MLESFVIVYNKDLIVSPQGSAWQCGHLFCDTSFDFSFYEHAGRQWWSVRIGTTAVGIVHLSDYMDHPRPRIDFALGPDDLSLPFVHLARKIRPQSYPWPTYRASVTSVI
jgi:hypothetical protein